MAACQNTSSLKYIQTQLKAIAEIDKSIFRMVQFKAYIAQFSCFDEADSENVAVEIQAAKVAIESILNDVKTTRGDFAARWVSMHRVLMRRECALTEAQTNGILTRGDAVYDTLVQKQVQLTQMLDDSEVKLSQSVALVPRSPPDQVAETRLAR